MSEKIENVRKWIYERLVWLLLLLAALLFILSKLDWFIPEVNSILEKLSFAVVSSGVFAAVLKSLQFQGIFKEELESIILSDDFIDTRRDKEKLWLSVSKAMHEKKFPTLSDELNNIILDEYFPKKRNYYYDDYRFTLNINELTEDGLVKFTQTIQYEVVMQKNEKKALLTGRFTIDKPDPGSTNPHKNERVYFKIDGENIKDKLKTSTEETEFEIRTSYHTTVENKEKFLVQMKDNRSHSIYEDNVKIIRTGAITKEMNVSITYPDNMTVQFFNIGVVTPFEKAHVEHKQCISRIHKKGLILPHQGFGMSFGFKKV